MKTRAARRSHGLATARVERRLSPIEATCTAVLSAAAGTAYAQVAPLPTPGEAMETVVVTGIRHAIEDALAVKRQSGDIVEVVSAEDIGKLPDITQQSSTGYDAVNTAAGVVKGVTTRGTSYTDVLPSLDLVFDFGHDRYIRTSAAETVARPRMDDLRSNITAGVSPIERTWSGSGGNPLLQPWRANAYDVSFESTSAR
jgi:outer membrane receptor protein involved in Fe transport